MLFVVMPLEVNKMVDKSICEWLIDNADAPIRYRVLRELIKNEKTAREIETELLENPIVKLWLKNLKPETPPQHWSMEHGSADFCLENALSKIIQLGLHGGFTQVVNAAQYYINKLETNPSDGLYRNNSIFKLGFPNMVFYSILIANFFTLAGITNESICDYMLGSLDVLYNFVSKHDYNIYVSGDEKTKLKAVPTIWKNKNFIKKNLVEEYGFCYPLVYDIVGLYKLYELMDTVTNKKINAVIEYISTDEFHHTVSDGYGILISGDSKYHAMGWDPKFPGWFDVVGYIENINARKLLFFAQHISKYPFARKTKWFGDLLCYLDKYRTEKGTYIFPADWLKEQQGYAVQGNHISFGENRRKKNWREIESTFYVQLLYRDI